jgi:NAD(P)-dependent dehydrogenase (short-subunit alcohol dehydrogenase family)
MGRAAALRFAHEGAHVVATDVRLEAAQETAALHGGGGGTVTAEQLDVTDLAGVRACIDGIGERHGVLHVLYNHAGTPGAAGLDASEQDWAATVDITMKSAYYASSYAVDLLRKAEGKGSIVFTASVSALTGSPYSPLYSMAKGGIVMMMKSLALGLAADGIRCNAICPASVQTPMLRGFLDRGNKGLTDEEMEGFVKQTIPLGRAAAPEEIAAVALFLASDESSFITGVALPVDGGYTAR